MFILFTLSHSDEWDDQTPTPYVWTPTKEWPKTPEPVIWPTPSVEWENYVEPATPTRWPKPGNVENDGNGNQALVIGLSVGGGILVIAVIAFLAIFIIRKKRKSETSSSMTISLVNDL